MTEDSKGAMPVVKTYRVRWWILLVYIVYSALSGLQWMEYSIITNLVMKYYDVNVNTVDWTSMVFMVVWPLFVFPASFLTDSGGLRVAALWGAILSALGLIIKIFSTEPTQFYAVMIGQALAGISQVFTFTLPPKVASTWFPPKEVSTVCSLGVFSLTLGTAMGFIIPPMVVRDHDNLEDIGSDLKMMCWGLAIPATVAALTVFFYFPKQPLHAPCLAVHYQRENRTTSLRVYFKQVLRILKNKPFLLHCISYTCVFGTFSAFGTILNQVVLQYFEGAQEFAGRIGLLMTVISIPSTVAIGVILDKTRRFKESAVVVTLACAISLGGFLYGLMMRLQWMCYASISLLGIFFGAYMTLGFELATELTYPLPESVVSSILVAVSQIICIGMTMGSSSLNVHLGAIYSLGAQIGIFVLGAFTTIVTPNRLYRQEAYKDENAFRDVKFHRVERGEKEIGS